MRTKRISREDKEDIADLKALRSQEKLARPFREYIRKSKGIKHRKEVYR